MSAVWCVKCNFSTMILPEPHDTPARCIRETPELRQALPRTSELPCEQYDRENIAVDAPGSQP